MYSMKTSENHKRHMVLQSNILPSMSVFSVDCNSVWSKVFLFSKRSRDHYVILIFFIKTLGTSRMIIWFWITLMKERRVDFDVTRRYRVSNFVELMGKNYRIKVIRPYSANYYSIFKISFIKNDFFLALWKKNFFCVLKKIFPLHDICPL